ncbi:MULTISPECIES: PRC-barrel domain-containing protein, partial [unclassified Paracoccus (in: a-proteobacteria)]
QTAPTTAAPDQAANDSAAAPAAGDQAAGGAAATDANAKDTSAENAGIQTAAAQIAQREGQTVVNADEVVATGLDGLQVFASDDEEIGEVDSFDTANNAAIVSVGGFLGMGERQVSLPMDQISFQRDGEGTVRAYIAQDSEQIEDMPEYKPAE